MARTFRRCLVACLLVVSALAALAGPALAQAENGSGTGSTSDPGSLAFTGSDVSMIVLTGLALVIVGVTLLVVVRRRMRTTSI